MLESKIKEVFALKMLDKKTPKEQGDQEMAFSVNTNAGALIALQNLNKTSSALERTQNTPRIHHPEQDERSDQRCDNKRILFPSLL